MIELYDVNDINFSSSLSFDSMLKNSFSFAIIMLAIFIVISLIIWLVGAKIKSENAIIKLAMPIRRNFSIYKHCNYFIKNDCKFKQC